MWNATLYLAISPNDHLHITTKSAAINQKPARIYSGELSDSVNPPGVECLRSVSTSWQQQRGDGYEGDGVLLSSKKHDSSAGRDGVAALVPGASVNDGALAFHRWLFILKPHRPEER